jgi:hypothetical protein
MNPDGSVRQRFIVEGMRRSRTIRACVIAWLLCVVLGGLAVHPPHCDFCEGPVVAVSSSSHPLASDSVPLPPDGCNGICWCCGFHSLPHTPPQLPIMNKVKAVVVHEPASPPLTPPSPVFRPPRANVS